MLASTLWLRKDVYELALVFQLAFYALASLRLFPLKLGIVSRLADVSLAFLVLNSAAAVAFLYVITGRKAIWSPNLGRISLDGGGAELRGFQCHCGLNAVEETQIVTTQTAC